MFLIDFMNVNPQQINDFTQMRRFTSLSIERKQNNTREHDDIGPFLHVFFFIHIYAILCMRCD